MARTYPRYAAAHNTLGNLYRLGGEFEKALPEFQESYRLRTGPDIVGVMAMYVALDRFDDAKAIAQRELAQRREYPNMHLQLLRLAHMQGDRTAAEEEIHWYAGKPQEYQGLLVQISNAKALGQWRNAEQLSNRALQLVKRLNLAGVAETIQAGDPEVEATVGNCDTARSKARSWVQPDRTSRQMSLSGLALALCGDADRAMKVADETSTRFPVDTLSNAVYVPSIRAAIELSRDQPGNAIELLQSASP